MIPEFGLFCVILAFALACIPGGFLFAGASARANATPLIRACVRLAAPLALAALASLIVARVQNDFSVIAVAQHSNRALPLLYKIVGAWGAHEGSMLLWVCVMACFAAGLSFCKDALVPAALCVQSALLAGALAFILFTSNPFLRQFPPPYDGAALTPLLQDVALAMHPPMLYLGYVGFSVAFSLAAAGLLEGRINAAWARLARPWILLPWTALTLGIGLGSWWAYRVLGWGGFWFWDPVENASLLPWLTGTALLHANLVLARRGMLALWVPLLAILTFAMSLIGTFLVRSGMITSVHSFASDPTRGVYILSYFVLSIGGALWLYAQRARPSRTRAEALSREGIITLNNLLFVAAAATVLLGTLYPLIAQWLGQGELTVGAPYFKMTVLPVLALALLLGGAATRIAWNQDTWQRTVRALEIPALAAGAAALIVLALAQREAALAAFGLALAAWMAMGAFRRGNSLAVMLSHGGAALVVVGIAGAGLWQQQVQMDGARAAIGPYTAVYDAGEKIQGPNYTATVPQLRIEDARGMVLGRLSPQARMYDSGEAVNTPAILPRLWGDIYAVAGNGGVMLRLEPLVRALWLGCALMAMGGIVALGKERK